MSLILDVSDNYQIEKFISESEIMLHLDHPNILNLMGMCFSMEDNLPAIVLPYMENGDLRKFLLTKRGQMRDSEEQFPKVSIVTSLPSNSPLLTMFHLCHLFLHVLISRVYPRISYSTCAWILPVECTIFPNVNWSTEILLLETACKFEDDINNRHHVHILMYISP